MCGQMADVTVNIRVRKMGKSWKRMLPAMRQPDAREIVLASSPAIVGEVTRAMV